MAESYSFCGFPLHFLPSGETFFPSVLSRTRKDPVLHGEPFAQHLGASDVTLDRVSSREKCFLSCSKNYLTGFHIPRYHGLWQPMLGQIPPEPSELRDMFVNKWIWHLATAVGTNPYVTFTSSAAT